MKNMIVVILTLTLFSCVKPPEPTISWHNICFPIQYLTPASIHFSTQSDPNFDTYEGGPTVSYEAEYLAQKLPNYHPNYAGEDGHKLWNHTMVSILLREKPGKIDSAELDVAPFEDSKNLFKQTNDPYSWTLFDKSNGELERWGRCYLSSGDNYDCMRGFYHKDMLLTYDIHMSNLALYKELDEFIINDLKQWQCK